MADHSRHITLAAGVVSQVILAGDYQRVTVVLRDAGEVYVRSDATDPGVEADDTRVIVGGTGAYETIPAYGATTDIRLVSAAAVRVSVIGES